MLLWLNNILLKNIWRVLLVAEDQYFENHHKLGWLKTLICPNLVNHIQRLRLGTVLKRIFTKHVLLEELKLINNTFNCRSIVITLTLLAWISRLSFIYSVSNNSNLCFSKTNWFISVICKISYLSLTCRSFDLFDQRNLILI